jgi:hypothetical protein
MTNVTVSDGNLVFEVEGWDKLWSLRSRLVIPIKHVSGVYADPDIAKNWWQGLRLAGTHIPGVIAAGTFYRHGDWVFWDVHKPENAVVVDLRDEHYGKLIIEVADPTETVNRIHAEISRN